MIRNRLPWVLTPLLLSPLLMGQSPLFTYGKAGGTRFISDDVAFIGDVDADGRADVILRSIVRGGYQIRSGRTGALIRQSLSGSLQAACGLGDVDGDRYGDYLLTFPSQSFGQAALYSGKSGKVLWQMPKTNTVAKRFDCSAIADIDGDKIQDVLVTTRGYRNGEVHLVSGKTGKAIRAHGSNPVLYENHGWAIAALGDADADGVSDYMVAAPLIRTVTVYSGKTGKVIRWHIEKKIDTFGAILRGLGDLDRDGVDDYLISARTTTLIYSGKTGLLIQDLKSTIIDCANAGDLNGDGVADILVGRSQPFGVQLLSGKTRKVLWEDTPTPPVVGVWVGAQVAGGVDINADGTKDFLYTLARTRTGPILAHLMSGKSLDFHADMNDLSTRQGGKIRFQLEAGKPMATRLYIVLGTVSGTRPGIPLGNKLTLPLQADAWFWATLSGPNAAPLTNSLGFLDLTGKSHADFSLPPLRYPFLKGLTFHHAYVLFSKDMRSLVHASHPVPLRIF